LFIDNVTLDRTMATEFVPWNCLWHQV